VDIRVLPSELEDFLGGGMIFSIPIFVLFLCGVIFGLFVGFVWEWIREMKHRSASSRKSKELAKVENELSQLKRESGQNEDEILLLLNNKANS
tara:strand:- start:3779 stop:4057 length:279 start_codon:yes stop_codon:yes gene_type:complete